MAEQKRRLVMDIVAPPPAPEPPAKKLRSINWSRMGLPLRALHLNKVGLVVCIVVVVLAVVVGATYLARSGSDSLPAGVTKNAGFPLYYPSPLPDGYTYQKNSAKIENGYVFYTLQYGDKSMSVSEQAAPSNPPDLTHLVGFTSLNTLAGSAAAGTNLSGQPSAIIVSNTTMITLTGQRGLPSDVVAKLAQNMRSLP